MDADMEIPQDRSILTAPQVAQLNRDDKEYVFLCHVVRKSPALCDLCKTSIMEAAFGLLARRPNNKLNIAPKPMVEFQRLPGKTQKQFEQAALEQAEEFLDDPGKFEALWKSKWLPMFEAAVRQWPAMEEWLTKLWLACFGKYTLLDLARGRMFSGRGLDCFENMHLRRLTVQRRPYHIECKCSDIDWEFPDPGIPRAASDSPCLDAHHAVLAKFVDHRILRAHDEFNERPVPPFATRPPILPLAQIWDDAEFQAVLEPLKRVAKRERLFDLEDIRAKIWLCKAERLRLSMSPSRDEENAAAAAAERLHRQLMGQSESREGSGEGTPSEESDIPVDPRLHSM